MCQWDWESQTKQGGKTKIIFGSRKYLYPPHERSLEILRGRGVSAVKIDKGKYKAKKEFNRGGRVQARKPFMGEV